MKHSLIILSVAFLLVACSPASSSSGGASSSSPTLGSAPFYEATNGDNGDVLPKKLGDMPYYVDAEVGANRPYASVKTFLSLAKAMDLSLSDYTFAYSGGVGTFSFPNNDGLYFAVNVNEGTLTSNNFAQLGLMGKSNPLDLTGKGLVPNTLVELSEITKNSASVVTLSLAKNSLKAFYHNDDIYLPPSVLSKVINYTSGYDLVYNGEAFYWMNSSHLGTKYDGSLNTLTSAYYGGPWSDSATKTQAEANYDANSFLFLLDNIYGFKKDRPELSDGYGEYLKKERPGTYENLFSTTEENVLKAYDEIINNEIGDIHSGVNSKGAQSGVPCGSFYNKGSHAFSAKDSDRSLASDAISARLLKARQNALGLETAETGQLEDKYVEISGDTAVIRFDEFMSGTLPVGTSDETYENNVNRDSFATFYTAFRKIDAAGSVKKVVVDITCNIGGAAFSLLNHLGFVAVKPSYWITDMTAEYTFAASFLTDCNSDGKYEASESPANRYEMFVLTSGASFSCGNAFPYFAKQAGVKILGEKSGGGACSPINVITSDGYALRLSGPSSIGKDSVSSPNIEDGVAVDIAVPESAYYDISALKTYLPSA